MGCVLDVVRVLYSIKGGDVEKVGGIKGEGKGMGRGIPLE